jgi:pimeloyl-ACP methyl ester carboxylesterase
MQRKMSSSNSSAQTHRWFRYIAAGIFILFILLAITGAVYQSISSARDRQAHPMPGQLIDVGGYKMHIDCAGQGTPAVILDSGLGDSYISWRQVQPLIMQFTRVCSYDRAGLGYSDASPHPRISKDIAEELHTLLHNAEISPPYVLVGHSMGGFDVRLFASVYRSEVTGMVLVDSSHPEQQKRFPPALNDLDATWLREQEFLELAMPFGLPRILGFCGDDAEARAAECNFHGVHESVAELKAIAKSAAQTGSSGPLGDMPLAVLSHDPDKPQPDLPEDLVKPANDAWSQMQKELVQLSSRGSQVIAKNSGHYIQLDRPDVVVEAVRGVVAKVHEAK